MAGKVTRPWSSKEKERPQEKGDITYIIYNLISININNICIYLIYHLNLLDRRMVYEYMISGSALLWPAALALWGCPQMKRLSSRVERLGGDDGPEALGQRVGMLRSAPFSSGEEKRRTQVELKPKR